ncbi:hypothetical protein MMC20_006196 [Loxospora ochrophaea]|nr:hypothetical protein [Loxospora ochrophaea]
MESFGFPDWNKIGRDIGKRLRDIINPPSGDSGPSKEERKEQRLRDVHKGFAYFDNFDEIESWSPEHVDPLQRSNTPLFERPTTPVSDQSKPSAKVLLCHDYNGGYHDYESVRPSKLDAELYSCEYLQYVDTFIYFSHKLVCIPPPTWTNTLHRNGVKALGTFIIEPQTQDEQRTLSQTDGRFCVAEQLAAMAQEFGFDGWLVNIEKEFSSCVTESLVSFMKNLKDALGHHGQVIWYDALDVDNQVNYQNGLTPRNLKFALAADGILTNYKWLEANIHDSAKIATVNAIGLSQVFFGIDVWAQNTNMPGPPRITFPPVGGGGTNTGLVSSLF